MRSVREGGSPRGACPPPAAYRLPPAACRRPTLTASGVRLQAADQEERLEVERRARRAQRRRDREHHEVVMEELVPKATGR